MGDGGLPGEASRDRGRRSGTRPDAGERPAGPGGETRAAAGPPAPRSAPPAERSAPGGQLNRTGRAVAFPTGAEVPAPTEETIPGQATGAPSSDSAAPGPDTPGDPLLEPWRSQLDALDEPWPTGPVDLDGDPFDLPPPPPPTLVAGRLAAPGSRLRPRDDDTMPLALVPLPRPAEEEVRYSLETPPQGLRKFDLGTVPASVTPPRTWRKAALFAVLTSAAVVCALAVAAVRLVGNPSSRGGIDSLPAYPTRPLEIEQLPGHSPSAGGVGSRPPASSTPSTSPTRSPAPASSAASPPPRSTATVTGTRTAVPPSRVTSTPPPATPAQPARVTVGAQPATPTDPTTMGDRTEQYFSLLTTNPSAAYQLCTGELASAGPEGLLARYADVTQIRVLRITIHRGHAVTLNVVRLVHADGTVTVEVRQLTFTRGSNPRISDDAITA